MKHTRAYHREQPTRRYVYSPYRRCLLQGLSKVWSGIKVARIAEQPRRAEGKHMHFEGLPPPPTIHQINLN